MRNFNRMTLKHAVVALVIAAGPWTVQAKEAATPATRSIHKVLVLALARDGAQAMELELALKEQFSKSGVSAESAHAFGKSKPENAQGLLSAIRQENFDSVLCMAPRKTITISSADRTQGLSTLEGCLTTHLTGNDPAGQPIELEPTYIEPPLSSVSGPENPSRTPIPTNPSAARVTMYKGTLRVFDTQTEGIILDQSVQVKVPGDARAGIRRLLIVQDILTSIKTSGLLPK